MSRIETAGTFVTDAHIAAAGTAMADGGCYLIENAYDADSCARMRAWLDSVDDAGAEINYGGSEKRVWNAEKFDAEVRVFTERSDEFLTRMLGSPQRSWTTLAIRNRPANLADPSNVRGRWHTDSFRRQYKLFLFLTDVNDATGPFEHLPATQHMRFKMRMALGGHYFGLREMLAGRRAYSKLPDDLVNGLIGSGMMPYPVKCGAGTVMVVDTSAIHRARPCVEGARYALTTYFR